MTLLHSPQSGKPKLVKAAAQPLKPLLGCQSYSLPKLQFANAYRRRVLDLVDYTGRQVYPGKRGETNESEPKALDKLGLKAEHWAYRDFSVAAGFGAK